MMNKLKINSSELFLKLFFSYVLFLIIPVIIFASIFYTGIISYFESQIGHLNENKLQLIQSNIDNLFMELSRNSMKISVNKNIFSLNYLSEGQPAVEVEDILKIRDIGSTLWDVECTNPDIASIYLYSAANKKIITRDSIVDLSNFMDKEWVSEYEKNPQKVALLKSRIPSDNKDYGIRQVVTLIQPLSMYMTNLNGVVVINIYENSILKTMDASASSRDEYTFVLNEKGEIFAGDNSKIKVLKAEDLKILNDRIAEADETGYFMENINGSRYVVTFCKSKVFGLNYVDVSPVNTLFSKVMLFKTMVVVLSIVLIILGIALSYFLSNRIYNPVKKIVESLQSAKGIILKDSKNELAAISSSINNIIEEEKNLNNTLEAYNKDLKKSHLFNLIMGNSSEEEHAKDCKIPDGNYVCIVASIDRYQEFIEKYSYSRQCYIKLLLLKSYEGIINLYTTGYGVLAQENKFVLIVNVLDVNDTEVLINKICADIRNQISMNEDISITMGIGGCYQVKENMRLSYMQAVEAANYKLLSGHGSTINYKDICSKQTTYYYPIEKEKHILNCLEANSQSGIHNSVTEFVDEIINNSNLTCENIMHIFYQLVGNTIKHLMVSNISIKDIFKESDSIYKELTIRETIEDIRNWLQMFYEEIINYLKNNNAVDKKYMSKILDYLKNNYTRSDIGIQSASEAINISYSYMRKIFKEYMGSNFIDYLNSLRIEHAKKLLLETELTNNEIAEKVGYNNDLSFTRNFKKQEGITPGEYKKHSKCKKMPEVN